MSSHSTPGVGGEPAGAQADSAPPAPDRAFPVPLPRCLTHSSPVLLVLSLGLLVCALQSRLRSFCCVSHKRSLCLGFYSCTEQELSFPNLCGSLQSWRREGRWLGPRGSPGSVSWGTGKPWPVLPLGTPLKDPLSLPAGRIRQPDDPSDTPSLFPYRGAALVSQDCWDRLSLGITLPLLARDAQHPWFKEERFRLARVSGTQSWLCGPKAGASRWKMQ